MKVKTMSNEELIATLDCIYKEFFDYKGCIQSKGKLELLERIKKEMLVRMGRKG